MIAVVVAVIVIISSLIQLGYCFYFFFRLYSKDADLVADLAATDKNHDSTARYPVSVLICAKNEADNLGRNLPAILEQQYYFKEGGLAFEVIVVDDQSTDETARILTELLSRYAHLSIVSIPGDEIRTLPGKKFALSRGLSAAKHDIILMTDADCQPAGGGWLYWMSLPFASGKEIVAGYGGYFRGSSLVNLFTRAETVHTFLQYHTYNLAGLPYMAVGRNLACKKELLLFAQQQQVWRETASGDDDLLIQLCATRDNMVVNTYAPTFTYSEAKATFGAWFRQKQRHLSTGKLYKPLVQYLLSGYAMSQFLCVAGMIITFVFWQGLPWQEWALFAFLLRCLLIGLQYAAACYSVNERVIAFFWPIFDFLWPCYNLIFAPFIFWKNKQQWK